MRKATLADAPAVRTLLASALAPDPMFAWFFPDPDSRTESTAAFLGPILDRYLPLERVVVDDDGDRVLAVAVWRWPDESLRESPVAATLPTPGGIHAALVGSEHAARVSDGLAVLQSLYPQPPYVYLHLLAVDAGSRRLGLARRLLTAGLEQAESDGLPVVLATTNQANHGFYERMGLHAVASDRLGPTGPVATVFAT